MLHYSPLFQSLIIPEEEQELDKMFSRPLISFMVRLLQSSFFTRLCCNLHQSIFSIFTLNLIAIVRLLPCRILIGMAKDR